MDRQVFVLALLGALSCIAIFALLRARRRREGQLPRTSFGVPLSARLLFIVGGGLPLAASMQASKSHLDTATAFAVPIVLGFIGLALGGFGMLIARTHSKRNQAIRDRRAQLILKKIEAGETLDFSLYLRAFATTGKLPQKADINTFETRFRPVFDDMEEALAKALEPTAPMVALGLPGEHVGVGRIETAEESWKEMFQRLAASAAILLLLPSARPGTLHEIGWISEQGLWPKTVLFMPQQARNWEWKTEELAEQWSATQHELARAGVTIPDYRKCGMLFSMNGSGNVVLYRPQGRNKLETILPEFVQGIGLKPVEQDLIECSECGYAERWEDSSMISTCLFCGTSVIDRIAEIEQRRKQVRHV